MPQIIDSVGIEIEFSEVDRKSRNFLNDIQSNLPRYQVKHDASCETPTATFGGVPVNFGSDADRKIMSQFCAKAIIGGELASPIIDSNAKQWINEVVLFCDILKAHGETENSKRDSFHVHVNVSREAPLYVLQNLVRMILAYEAIMFRLGGMGRMNRGEENQYTYQRPYLGNGPPIVSYEKSLYPILSPEHLLASTSIEQFFERFGDSWHCKNKVGRYVSQRYMVVNFYSILNLGSLEFRTANKTLNPEYIIAYTNFCKAFVQKAWERNIEEELQGLERPLYENREISVEEFDNAMSMLNLLKGDTINALLRIWSSSPTPRFDNVRRFSHLPEPSTWSRGSDKPDKLTADEAANVEEAIFLDVHELNRQFNRQFNRHMPEENVRDFDEILDNMRVERAPDPPIIHILGIEYRLDDLPVIELPEQGSFMWGRYEVWFNKLKNNFYISVYNEDGDAIFEDDVVYTDLANRREEIWFNFIDYINWKLG